MKENSASENEFLLAFPIDWNSVLSDLKKDMRDDWFFDSINYNDLFNNTKNLTEIISEVLFEGNGKYIGSLRNVYDFPKKSFGIRYSLETDFYDRFLYQATCSFLIKYFDPLLSPRVLGHRYNKRRDKEKHLFKNRMEMWRTFEGVTYTAFGCEKTLLVTDLINYYENISFTCIKDSFESKLNKINANGPEKLKVRNAIACLCDFLKRWGYSENHGLPQNRDASSFVANVVLSDIDHKMVNLGYDYYRYVDDIRIICDTPVQARKALTDLIVALRSVGMNINSAKTDILTSANTAEKIAEFFPSADDRLIAIDSMWRSKSRRIISRSVQYVVELLKECVEKKETQSRQFRFSVNRLIRLIESGVFEAYSGLQKETIDLLVDSLADHPASTDYYCRLLSVLDLSSDDFDKIVKYLLDFNSSIYSWQNYNLWIFLAKKKYKSDQLLDFALHKIDNEILSSDVPAIFIYLNCIGMSSALKPLIEKFSSAWPYAHQRFFLFSVNDFPEEDLRPLVEKLGVKMRGTIKRAAPHFDIDGLPLVNMENVSILDLYDELDEYE